MLGDTSTLPRRDEAGVMRVDSPGVKIGVPPSSESVLDPLISCDGGGVGGCNCRTASTVRGSIGAPRMELSSSSGGKTPASRITCSVSCRHRAALIFFRSQRETQAPLSRCAIIFPNDLNRLLQTDEPMHLNGRCFLDPICSSRSSRLEKTIWHGSQDNSGRGAECRTSFSAWLSNWHWSLNSSPQLRHRIGVSRSCISGSAKCASRSRVVRKVAAAELHHNPPSTA